MDSSKWSEEKKVNAASRFANRMHRLLQSASFRAESRRNKVAVDLSIAVAESQLTRQAVADKAGMKLSQLSRQLSGDVNLTLDSIGKICEAVGYDFDLVLRKTKDKAALQPWQYRLDRTALVHMVNEPVHQATKFKSLELRWSNPNGVVPQKAANDVDEFSYESKAA
jgi:transcriptional regulator with XRE-family HTH domain